MGTHRYPFPPFPDGWFGVAESAEILGAAPELALSFAEGAIELAAHVFMAVLKVLAGLLEGL